MAKLKGLCSADRLAATTLCGTSVTRGPWGPTQLWKLADNTHGPFHLSSKNKLSDFQGRPIWGEATVCSWCPSVDGGWYIKPGNQGEGERSTRNPQFHFRVAPQISPAERACVRGVALKLQNVCPIEPATHDMSSREALSPSCPPTLPRDKVSMSIEQNCAKFSGPHYRWSWSIEWKVINLEIIHYPIHSTEAADAF